MNWHHRGEKRTASRRSLTGCGSALGHRQISHDYPYNAFLVISILITMHVFAKKTPRSTNPPAPPPAAPAPSSNKPESGEVRRHHTRRIANSLVSDLFDAYWLAGWLSAA